MRVALLFGLAIARASERCDEFVGKGYCTGDKTVEYMKRHCAGYCDSGGGGGPEEDSACARWASEGYCTNEEYASYMSTTCPQACGLPPSTAAADSDVGYDESAEEGDAEVEEETEEEEEAVTEGEEEEEAGAQPPAASSAGAAQTSAAGAAASESEHCKGWARQGLCEGGEHAEYMQQNCARACEAAANGEDDGGAALADPIRCAQWAIQGLCDPASAHVVFMNQNCAKECELQRNRDPNAGMPPPADLFVVLLVAGFGYLAVQMVRRTMAADSSKSLEVQKTLGVERGVGPGKNKVGGQGRSAKKDRAKPKAE